jgi:hypothetical protein
LFVPSVRIKFLAVEKKVDCAKFRIRMQVAYDVDGRRPAALSALTVMVGLVEHLHLVNLILEVFVLFSKLVVVSNKLQIISLRDYNYRIVTRVRSLTLFKLH